MQCATVSRRSMFVLLVHPGLLFSACITDGEAAHAATSLVVSHRERMGRYGLTRRPSRPAGLISSVVEAQRSG